jgi:hypothetical protein
MKNDKIRFPVSNWERTKNRLGKKAVPCVVSDRWAQLHGPPSSIGAGSIIGMDIMTKNENGETKKICQLMVAIEDLERAIEEAKKH